jgi:thiamine kinase-like enzyme
MFLANFLWFYAGHSEGSRRRGSVKGLIAVIDSYKSAFREQVERSVKTLEEDRLNSDPNQRKEVCHNDM